MQSQKKVNIKEHHFKVVYEDENIILCNKRPGVLVHEDDDGKDNTLIMHIKAYLYQKGEYDPENEQSFAPALCNRIDRNTGGIVIGAKNAEALRVMNEKIKNDEISKFYYCVVHGKMPKKADALTGFLLKDSDKNQVKIFDKQVKGSKNIITKYKVISERNGMSLLEIELVTGRTHQIRVHLSAHGFPVLCDPIYGRGASRLGSVRNPELLDFLKAHDGQMLHAEVLEFAHPITGEHMRFKTRLPDDMLELKCILEDM